MIDMTNIKSHKSYNPINHGSDNSYDIIKAHDGEIKVETKEGEFGEFVIMLPKKDDV